MLIVLGLYALLIWLIFFKLKLLPWSRVTKILVSLVGLIIVLIVIGALNTKTPSGRVTVIAKVIEIAPVVGGTVTSIPVTLNTTVTAGTVLLEIDKTLYKASLDEAKASLKLAEITYDRKQTVFKKNKGAVSKQSVDESKAEFEIAKARLDRAQYEYDNTVLMAPSDGIVTAVGLSVGDQAQPMNPIMPFIRTDSLFLSGVFEQNGLNGMPPGTPVKIIFDRKPGQIYTSEVVLISPGTSSGQISVGANLLSALDIGSTSEALVVLAWPEGLEKDVATAGTVGSATAIGPDAGAMGILATVLLYFKMIGTYL